MQNAFMEIDPQPGTCPFLDAYDWLPRSLAERNEHLRWVATKVLPPEDGGDDLDVERAQGILVGLLACFLWKFNLATQRGDDALWSDIPDEWRGEPASLRKFEERFLKALHNQSMTAFQTLADDCRTIEGVLAADGTCHDFGDTAARLEAMAGYPAEIRETITSLIDKSLGSPENEGN